MLGLVQRDGDDLEISRFDKLADFGCEHWTWGETEESGVPRVHIDEPFVFVSESVFLCPNLCFCVSTFCL